MVADVVRVRILCASPEIKGEQADVGHVVLHMKLAALPSLLQHRGQVVWHVGPPGTDVLYWRDLE